MTNSIPRTCTKAGTPEHLKAGKLCVATNRQKLTAKTLTASRQLLTIEITLKHASLVITYLLKFKFSTQDLAIHSAIYSKELMVT